MTTTAEAYFRHEHADAPVRISTEADVDQLIDDLLAEDYENSVATLYIDGRLNAAGVPDHELLVGVNNEEGKVGSLRYMGGPGTFYGAGQTTDHDELVYYYTGHDREFPLDSELSIEAIRRAIKEFVVSGGERPESIEWQDWPEDIA
jgi:immunity protein Imm1 of predicted polymorphic toxin system